MKPSQWGQFRPSFPIGDYIDHHYPNRPHSRLGYRTPLEVRQTWEGSIPSTEASGLSCQRGRGPRQSYEPLWE